MLNPSCSGVQGPLQPGHLQIPGDGLDLLGDVVELVVASSSEATHQFTKTLLHLLGRNLIQAGGVVSNDGGQVGRIPLGGVHDLVQAPRARG